MKVLSISDPVLSKTKLYGYFSHLQLTPNTKFL